MPTRIRTELKPGPHDDFLLEQSTKDAVVGFATALLRWSQLVRHTKRRADQVDSKMCLSEFGQEECDRSQGGSQPLAQMQTN